MRKILLIVFSLVTMSGFSQIKFSDLPTYLGAGDSVWVPTVVSGVNRKMYGKDLAKTRLDSLVTALGGKLSSATAAATYQPIGSYLTGNQTIVLSGDITGTGPTAITTTIGAGKVTNSMLAGSIAASKLIGTDISAVGTITAGTWQGTPIANAYISGATNWNTAYDKRIVSLSVTGTTTKTVTATLGDGTTVTATFNDETGAGGSGITSLNALTGTTQTFATGTTGTDFGISSSGSTHTFNLPTASASNRGLLSTADWSTFNNKISNITGLVTAGTNVTITGSGTSGSPYVINSSGGGGGVTQEALDDTAAAIRSAGVQFYVDTTLKGAGTSGDPLGVDKIKLLGYFDVVKYGANPNDTLDDASAIQAAMDACVDSGGGIVYFPAPRNDNGYHYLVKSALVTSAESVNPNAQLLIPYVAMSTKMISLKLLGETPFNFSTEAVSGVERNNNGVIIESTITGSGTTPAVFGTAWSNMTSIGDRNYVEVTMENIIVRTSTKSGSSNIAGTMSAINFSHLIACHFDNVKVDISSRLVDAAEPTNETFGIILPSVNNKAMLTIGTVFAEGYKYGLVLQEHLQANYIVAAGCIHGLIADHSYHAINIQQYLHENCVNGLTMRGEANIFITSMHAEHHTSGWWVTDYDVYFETTPAAVVPSYAGNLGYTRQRSVHIGHFNQVTPSVGVENSFLTNNTSRVYLNKIGNVDFNETIQTVSYSATPTINLNNGYKASLSLTGNATVTFSGNEFVGKEFVMIAKQDATGGRTLTIEGKSVSITSTADAVSIVKGIYDGTEWFFYSSSGGASSGTGNATIDAWVTAQSSLSSTLTSGEISAVQAFVEGVESAGLTSKIKDFNPLCGSNASGRGLNVYNPANTNGAHRITFNGGGWTHNSSGSTGNGTSSYADLNFIPSTAFVGANNWGAMIALGGSLSTTSEIPIGCYSVSGSDNNGVVLVFNYNGTNSIAVGNNADAGNIDIANPSYDGIHSLQRRSSTDLEWYRSSVTLGTDTGAETRPLPTLSLYAGARNSNSVASNFSSQTIKSILLTDGLTDSEENTVRGLLQTMLTALGR